MPSGAVLDADIVRSILGISKDSITSEYDAVAIFKKIMNGLDKTPIIHEYVYQNELILLGPNVKTTLQSLVSEGYIKIVGFKDHIKNFGNNSIETQLYIGQFSKLRNSCKMELVPEGMDIFKKAKGWSFGEIHSYLMAVSLGYEFFYSNDCETKNFHFSFPSSKKIVVKSIKEIFSELKTRGNSLRSSIEKAIINRSALTP